VKGGLVNELAVGEFREYVAARQAVLYRSAVLLTGNRQDAEDLLQTALARLAVRWHTIQRTGSPSPTSPHGTLGSMKPGAV
jgi:DNA-directed RNA polymerase specialized sigma24 family protein